MNFQIRDIEICDETNPFHGQKKNLFLKDGKIQDISNEELEAESIVDGRGLKISPGWFDMRAFFADPGFEHKEDILSGCEAAAAGGFTGVALLPNTQPVVQSKNEISYIRSRNYNKLIQLYPYGAVTQHTKGEELTEMMDMHKAGAIAFTDGEKPIWHTDILLKTLQYLQQFDGLLINKPEDKLLTQFGNMNEGISSTMLGLKGMPRLAEELMIMRDLKILEYAGGKIHFSNISSAGSVNLIKEAKDRGLNVTCDVAVHQLIFDDQILSSFDTDFKVNPPFREKTDIEALIAGLKDDTIDVIVSSHLPQDEENKKLEFDLAEFGIISLQTVLPNLILLKDKIEFSKLLPKITNNPRRILNQIQPEIKVGHLANLTIFDTNKEWIFNDHSNRSKSKNSPFYNQKLTGKVLSVFNNNNFWMDEALIYRNEET